MASNPFANYYGTSTETAGQTNANNPPFPETAYTYNANESGVSVVQAAEHQPMGTGMTEVDLSRYPEPKESTKKLRGISDVREYFFGGQVNRELLIAKAFYFFFFSAFGSLLPLMAIYFKNMGMTPTQAGILIGIRPFVGYLSAPFWADLADRFKKGRVMLLGSLAAWVVFNVPLGFIRPPATSCLVYNASGFFIQTPKVLILSSKSAAGVNKRSVSDIDYFAGSVDDDVYPAGWTPRPTWIDEDGYEATDFNGQEIPYHQLMALEEEASMEVPLHDGSVMRVRRQSPMKPTHQVGMTPYKLDFAVNYKESVHSNWVSPTFSYTIFNLNDVRKVFFLFLLLIVIGEFFCCPSMTLADTAVLNLLGKENADQYGRQRMFASIGWGLTMFFVCLTLDQSNSFTNHPCQVHERERNYTVCYLSFTIFMFATMLVATRLPFDYPADQPSEESNLAQATSPVQQPAYVPPAPGSWYHPKGPPPPPPGSGHDHHTPKEIMGDALKNLLGKSKVFAQTTRQIPEWMPVLRHFANIKCATFMFVAWFMGFGIGLIFTFLFWHLQDYGGTSTVFGMASVVNHISEMLAYFLSYPLIRKIGHIKVLCLGLVCSVLRFLYISYITQPWGVIPFELVQGVTHSAVWAASCSYIVHNTPAELRASAQGVLSFVHNGAGRACGTIFGGIFSTAYGTTAVLRGYGFACIFVLIGFVVVCFYHRDKGFTADLTPAEDPHEMTQVAHLAPHGVPGNPTIVRTPSHANLEQHGSGVGLSSKGSASALFTNNHHGYDSHGSGGHQNNSNPFLPAGSGGNPFPTYGVHQESDEYSGISMNPTQGGSSYTHYNNQY